MIVTVQATSLLKQGNNISIFKVLGNVLIVPDIADEAVEAAEADWTQVLQNLTWGAIRSRSCIVMESIDGLGNFLQGRG